MIKTNRFSTVKCTLDKQTANQVVSHQPHQVSELSPRHSDSTKVSPDFSPFERLSQHYRQRTI